MNNIRLQPTIGIPTPTTIDAAYNQRSWKSYAAAAERSGGTPVEIELTLPDDALEAQAAVCDGFLLPGSPADVDPGLYNSPRSEACGPADSARERTDFFLLHHARRTRKPVLGICYGCQSINTFFGGSLIQNLSPLPVNHAAGASVAVAHTVTIDTESALDAILQADAATQTETSPVDMVSIPGNLLRLPVNTSHHQAVARPGEGLRAVAHCPDDGTVEAIELTALFHVEHPAFLLGVQWHPERSYEVSAASRALFAHLVAQAQAARSSRTDD